MNTDILHESASFISDANTAIAATGDEGKEIISRIFSVKLKIIYIFLLKITI